MPFTRLRVRVSSLHVADGDGASRPPRVSSLTWRNEPVVCAETDHVALKLNQERQLNFPFSCLYTCRVGQ